MDDTRFRSRFLFIGLCIIQGSGCGGDFDSDNGSLAEELRSQNNKLPPDLPVPLASLKTVPIPAPANLGRFVQDRRAAIRLGKALFWEMQIGSDGIQACASCHFRAGADSRAKNQTNPGSLSQGGSTLDLVGLNGTLTADLFPFHKFADPDNRRSRVLRDTDDVASSQGVVLVTATESILTQAAEPGIVQDDPVFHNARRVEPRQTPTVINAVFNFRNFWDGRAQNEFNGRTPFGNRDRDARVLFAEDEQSLELIRIELKDSSLASQAVGPPLSNFEMSNTNRTFAELGRKMLNLSPLAKQQVSPTDSVLGRLSKAPNPGIHAEYAALIRSAFQPEFWQSERIIKVSSSGPPALIPRPNRPLAADEFTQMQYNFSLFFGLAVQLYEATLIADDTPLDRFLEGETWALTFRQRLGLQVFNGKGKCINCHGGAELTNASVKNVRNQPIERMIVGDGGCAVYDNGFYNIGVRKTQEDLGVGGTDPFGNPLSLTKLAFEGLRGAPRISPPIGAVPACDRRANVAGAFKVPSLRNIELTAPYFHNGGQLTLRQVVDFYNRGGDFHENNLTQLDPDIQFLGLTEFEKDNLVEFLRGLTDRRVRRQEAPFDHPQLFIPNGHETRNGMLVTGPDGRAVDILVEIPAVGEDGGPLAPSFPNL